MVMRAAIDLAATRGAYQAADMSAIGTVFDKLSAFLEEFEAQQSATETATEENTGE